MQILSREKIWSRSRYEKVKLDIISWKFWKETHNTAISGSSKYTQHNRVSQFLTNDCLTVEGQNSSCTRLGDSRSMSYCRFTIVSRVSNNRASAHTLYSIYYQILVTFSCVLFTPRRICSGAHLDPSSSDYFVIAWSTRRPICRPQKPSTATSSELILSCAKNTWYWPVESVVTWTFFFLPEWSPIGCLVSLSLGWIKNLRARFAFFLKIYCRLFNSERMKIKYTSV